MTAGARPQTLGRYTLLRRLAVGGMAEIFIACAGDDPNEKVVCKRILPHLAADEDFVRMFLAEAQLSAGLEHPNVGRVLDVGRAEEALFFVMEYVAGWDLGALLTRLGEQRRVLPLPAALSIAIGICRGLHHAHERRDAAGQPLAIVHRDVSPANVLLSSAGEVKVIDFGIARATSRHTLTQQGVLRGKVAYMSPEQITGGKLDHRSDIYAVGTLLYEMITSRRPFVSDDDFALARMIPEADVPPPSQYNPTVPAPLEPLLLRALERERERRWPSAAALADALEDFARACSLVTPPGVLAGVLAEAFPEGPSPGQVITDRVNASAPDLAAAKVSRPRRRWDVVGIALTVGALVATGFAWFTLRQRDTLVEGALLLESYEAFHELAQAERRLLTIVTVSVGAAALAGALALYRLTRARRRLRRWLTRRRRAALRRRLRG